MNYSKATLLYALNLCTIVIASAPTIFVPRQLSYNPIFENALMCSSKIYEQNQSEDLYIAEKSIVSAKPIYTSNVGSKFSQYFTIDNKPVLNVQENGTGDVDSLWFQVISNPGSFYSSNLSFSPKRTTFGTMLYGLLNLTDYISASANTALISTRNNININESNIAHPGQVSSLQSVMQAFANPDMQYGAINGEQTKSGVDDIQLKFMYHSFSTNKDDNDSWNEHTKLFWEMYALAGIPTAQGSTAQYLFEPIVGSTHAQIGLGGNLHYAYSNLKFQAEAKWRYAFAGNEIRSFDLTTNGQWSRYMLVVNSLNTLGMSPAINNLTFPCQVTPGNSFDLYFAAYYDFRESWHAEVGYDLWVRQAEKIAVSPIFPAPSIGIADITNAFPPNNPTSASSANISQSTIGPNLALSDSPNFIALSASDFNLASACTPKSISNSIYGTIAYTKELQVHIVRTGLSLVYECGHGINVPNNISVMVNIDLLF